MLRLGRSKVSNLISGIDPKKVGAWHRGFSIYNMIYTLSLNLAEAERTPAGVTDGMQITCSCGIQLFRWRVRQDPFI